MDQKELDELAEDLDNEALQYLSNKTESRRYQNLRERIDGQVPGEDEIIADMTAEGYFKQSVELSKSITATFRCLSSGFQDECIDYANKNADTRLMYDRLLSKRRMAHSVLEINGQYVGPTPVAGSLFDLHMNPPEGADGPQEMIRENAEERFKVLELYPEVTITQVNEGFRAWESAIQDRLDDADVGETVKKSTGTPETA